MGDQQRDSRPPAESPAARPSLFWEYARLVRLPNVFTALADVMMGFLFVHHQLRPGIVFLCLALASIQLYLAGMVLNDVCDVERDRRERPDRPLPAGTIGLRAARRLGTGLLISGVVWGLLASLAGWETTRLAWRGGAVAALLAVCILLYNAVVKSTVLGPVLMGMCRALNVLLGMAVAASVPGGVLLGYTGVQLLTAAGIGVYVLGVTWLARTERRTSSRWQLASATIVMMWGIVLLALIYDRLPAGAPRAVISEEVWYVLLGLLGFTLVRRGSRAVAQPTPRQVQVAVTTAIWSLIILDASVALLVSPPGYAILIVALLVPTIGLGQWIKAT